MVTPSAPRLGSVEPSYVYPLYCDSDIEPLKKSERYELYTATDELLAGHGSLRKYLMDFSSGTTLLTFESHINSEFYGTMLLDMVATKFFSEHKEDIAQVNPPFSNYMESNILTKDLRKISELFYRAFNRYLEDKTTEEDGLDNIVASSTIANSKPGFKNFNRYCHYDNEHVTSSNILKGRAGEEFKKLIETLPTTLLTQKGKGKAALFLQAALDQKDSHCDKLVYLKEVLFLLTFQDVFKESLLELKQSLNMEMDNLYKSASRSHDLHSQSQYIRSRIDLIDKTLAKLPVNDILALIPLAYRSSLEELSQDRYFMNCYIKEESLSRECNKAREADIAIRKLLENLFHINLKNFSGEGKFSIDSFIMALSGLAISLGLLGRLAMKDHHKIFYKRYADCSIPSVSDNLPLEFLVTAAQFYSATNDNWIEETHLGYLKEMLGGLSPYEIEGLKYKIQRVREAVSKAPVEQLLKGNTLDKDAIKNLQSLYKDVRKNIGLAPLPKSKSSACSIM